jgi:hypothetical protein
VSEIRPYSVTIGSYRFTYRWRSWGCWHQKGGVGAFGRPSPVAAFRDCRRAWLDKITEGQRALYREKMAALGGRGPGSG